MAGQDRNRGRGSSRGGSDDRGRGGSPDEGRGRRGSSGNRKRSAPGESHGSGRGSSGTRRHSPSGGRSSAAHGPAQRSASGTHGGKPGARGSKPGTRGGKPGTRGGKPGARGGKPGARGGKPGTRGGKTGTQRGEGAQSRGTAADKSGARRTHDRILPSRGKGKPRRQTAAVRSEVQELRLNKFLAEAGVAARRKADELIAQGVVRVNGKVVTELGVKVNPQRDEVSVRGTPVYIQNQLYYILLNKPKDCITTTSDEKGRRTVMDLVPAEHNVYPVGRLDRNTTGALLLTNDGELANVLMHPRFNVDKAYIAETTDFVRPQDIQALREGVRLEDGKTRPCEAELMDGPKGKIVALVLHEGRNRQVRRMFETLGYSLRKLDRVGYAGLDLRGVRRGAWRYLNENEVRALKNLAAKQKL